MNSSTIDTKTFTTENWLKIEQSVDNTPLVTALIGDNRTFSDDDIKNNQLMLISYQFADMLYAMIGDYTNIIITLDKQRIRYDVNFMRRMRKGGVSLSLTINMDDKMTISTLWHSFIELYTDTMCGYINQQMPSFAAITNT